MSAVVGFAYILAGLIALGGLFLNFEYSWGGAAALGLGVTFTFGGFDEMYEIPGEDVIFFSLFFLTLFCFWMARRARKRNVG